MNIIESTLQQVAVIGGGIAGLATAYTLASRARLAGLSLRIRLYESEPRLGGKILSEQAEGFVVEGGPDSFLLQKPWAAQLAQELGLESELMGTNTGQRKIYLVDRGRLVQMPDGVMLIIPTRFMPFITSPLISWPGKIRMGMDFFIPRRRDDGDESVGAFIRRRLGKEALEKIAEPMMSGIHVSDPEMQSLLGTFPRFRNIEKQHGSLIRGMLAQRRAMHRNGKSNGKAPSPAWKNSAFITLRGGMSQLVKALESALRELQVEIHTGLPVDGLTPLPAGGYQIVTQHGTSTQVDAVVLATPAFISAGLVEAFTPQLAQALAGIRYVSTATISLAFKQSDWGHPIDGVGFLAPKKENRRISACTITSTKFAHRAPQERVLVRCFAGGPGHEEAVDRSDAELVNDARAELADLLGVRAEPHLARVFRWPKGNAQYDVGHLERVSRMHAVCAQTPGLYLTGSAYEGIGIPDCIHQGQQAAEKVLAYLSTHQPVGALATQAGG